MSTSKFIFFLLTIITVHFSYACLNQGCERAQTCHNGKIGWRGWQVSEFLHTGDGYDKDFKGVTLATDNRTILGYTKTVDKSSADLMRVRPLKNGRVEEIIDYRYNYNASSYTYEKKMVTEGTAQQNQYGGYNISTTTRTIRVAKPTGGGVTYKPTQTGKYKREVEINWGHFCQCNTCKKMYKQEKWNRRPCIDRCLDRCCLALLCCLCGPRCIEGLD